MAFRDFLVVFAVRHVAIDPYRFALAAPSGPFLFAITLGNFSAATNPVGASPAWLFDSSRAALSEEDCCVD